MSSLTTINTGKLDLTAVDFTNADEAIEVADRLCETANNAGIFLHEGDPERDRVTIKQAKRDAKDWLKAVRKHIDALSPADAQKLLPSYDTLHRVVYGQPADSSFLNKYIMAAFESRIRGNKDVDPYLLYRQIEAGIRRGNPIYFGRPLAWQTTILDRWYKDLTKAMYSGFPKGSEESLCDLLQKASILMETDLRIYEGPDQTAFKQSLFNYNTSMFYKIELLDLRTLEAMRRFICASRRYIPQELYASIHKAIKDVLVA